MPKSNTTICHSFSLPIYPPSDIMDPSPVIHIEDNCYEITNRQTVIFRMLYFCFSNCFIKKDFLEIIIEYFQHICFQISLMQKPVPPKFKNMYLSVDHIDLEAVLDDGAKICLYLSELDNEQRINGTEAFTEFLAEEPEDLVARYLHPALSGKQPLSKFFQPVVRDFMIKPLKSEDDDEGLGPSPAPPLTTDC